MQKDDMDTATKIAIVQTGANIVLDSRHNVLRVVDVAHRARDKGQSGAKCGPNCEM